MNIYWHQILLRVRNCRLLRASFARSPEKYNSQFQLDIRNTESVKSKNSISRRKRGEKGEVGRVVLACKSDEELTSLTGAASVVVTASVSDLSTLLLSRVGDIFC